MHLVSGVGGMETQESQSLHPLFLLLFCVLTSLYIVFVSHPLDSAYPPPGSILIFIWCHKCLFQSLASKKLAGLPSVVKG